MIRTFSDCESLESMADWTGDNALLNITECYEDCENLKQTCAIPESVKIAQSTFKGCKSLQETPDMSKANAIIDATGMYEDCSKLVKVSIPSNAENISSMFEDCINLKDMPEIPSTASIMSSTFRGDVSLTSLTSIPESVTDLSSCFADCQLASGPLVIDANAEKFSNMFDKAVLATKLDITEKSLLLDAYANTSSTGRVTVNGKSPKVPKDMRDKMPDDFSKIESWVKENGFNDGEGIGPGRGSAAGSLVCYLLGITNIDPIKYNLLFERFLNPERVSMVLSYCRLWMFLTQLNYFQTMVFM